MADAAGAQAAFVFFWVGCRQSYGSVRRIRRAQGPSSGSNQPAASTRVHMLTPRLAAHALQGAALSGSGGGATDEPQPKTGLTVDEFEHAIDKLELTHFEAVVAWWERTNEGAWQLAAPAWRGGRSAAGGHAFQPSHASSHNRQAHPRLPSSSSPYTHHCLPKYVHPLLPPGPSTSAARVPKIPGMKALLPKSKALDLFPDLDKKLASSLYDHWAKRRSALSGPLLPRLWFEQPWKVRPRAGLASRRQHVPAG